MVRNHVAQVAEELRKFGYSESEADHLAREKYRADSDLVRYHGRDPGEIAEQIVEREMAQQPGEFAVGIGPEGSAEGAEEIERMIAAANSDQPERHDVSQQSGADD